MDVAGGQPLCVKEFYDERTGKWEFKNWDGCFAAGTPVWVASVAGPLAIQARSASECIGAAGGAPSADDAGRLSHAAESACAVADAPTASAAELLLPIEAVPLGARVSTRNPDETDYDFSLPDPEASTWRRVALVIHRHDWARVEIELLRPAEWVARSGLAVGGLHFTNIEELELRGFARVTAIEACPPLAAGDGAVVTGRYITRGAGNLVRVTLEDGSELVGTAQHPIWSESRSDWTPLGELLPGEQLRARSGPLAVLAVTPLPGVADVYNLEIHGQHVYAITAAGVLVHNATACRVNIAANKRAGDAARDTIALREAPALTEQSFSTVGGIRRTDVLKQGEELVAIESKVGRTALDSRVRQELARDWWWLRQNHVSRVVWEFSPSAVTGKGGPTRQLLDKLLKLGFEVRITF